MNDNQPRPDSVTWDGSRIVRVHYPCGCDIDAECGMSVFCAEHSIRR